ncbi:HAD family hydrolase [Chitinophaga sp. sic0106]|uniref:HAD family hydrolase n=1 Tax=Chitinophaga sp. sic0106 TaxID=2854785 RepID=UPI001C47B8D2|nr:haloacid dehalogenase-like hydrolase [Chitinophaga sp. sic0106]
MTIAFFDFDGTITTRDTLWQIIRYQKGSVAMYAGIIRLLPALLAFKLKRIPAQEMKERVLAHYFGSMEEAVFRKGCEDFCAIALPGMLRDKALATIKKHQANGNIVVVVTASPRYWVEPWCKTLQIQCIGSELMVSNGRITGKIQGTNCNGEEKVNRIKKEFRLDNYRAIYAYGDSAGDLPMLALAGDKGTFKPFRD